MKVFNHIARELLELDEGDHTGTWGDEDGGDYPLNFELVHSALIDTTRWSNVHERVYKDLNTGKFYHTTYRVGATECQDERAYEYDGEEIEFTEVYPVEVKRVVYRSVK